MRLRTDTAQEVSPDYCRLPSIVLSRQLSHVDRWSIRNWLSGYEKSGIHGIRYSKGS